MKKCRPLLRGGTINVMQDSRGHQMLTARQAALRLLKLTMVASLVLPAVLFCFAAWATYSNFEHVTDDRISRSLDILNEHALKVMQTVEVSFAEIKDITQGMSDQDIEADQEALHLQLKKIADMLPQLQGIAIIDRNGHLLASSNVQPAPRNIDFSDRDYFKAQLNGKDGIYVSGIHKPRLNGLGTFFFAVSQRRASADGSFNGIVSIAVLPNYFEGFYGRMGRESGNYFALARADGGFLARYPLLKNRLRKLGPNTPFRRGIARGKNSDIYWVDSQLDHIERRLGYRKLAGYPLYVIAGVEQSAMDADWMRFMSTHLIFGVPATAFLFAGLMLAYRRTQRLYDEADRREAAEDALRQSQRLEAIGQLTGGVAHDFNNLLMVISGSVQRLRGELNDKKHRRLLDMMATAIQRGESLTRQLLTFSRKQTLAPQVIDLTQRLPAIRELLIRSLRADIEIKVEVPRDVCAVRVDPGELELAVLNLAINAKDAMPTGGVISIRARPVLLKGELTEGGLSGEFVAIRVADNGEGIPDDLLARVFEPFFTTKEVGKGTGLGLSQVYGFAKQAGGTATVTSKQGRGTVVTFYLPRSHEVPQTAAPKSPAQKPAESLGTVLLVEDNTDVAEVGAGLLRQLGYRVRSVANAQAAIAALRLDANVDLVFSDILMPGGMNGLDLAREIGTHFPHLPVLLTTGYSASAQDAVRRGVVVLQKPYDLETLQRSIREALEGARGRREHAVQAG
jgi:two-component system, NtrC family, sensor kinase